jgi:hypothetical protein
VDDVISDLCDATVWAPCTLKFEPIGDIWVLRQEDVLRMVAAVEGNLHTAIKVMNVRDSSAGRVDCDGLRLNVNRRRDERKTKDFIATIRRVVVSSLSEFELDVVEVLLSNRECDEVGGVRNDELELAASIFESLPL